MNGIVISIDPVIVQFGGFELRWYSIAIMLAIVAALVVATYDGKRRGFPADEIYSLLPWVLVAGLAGARLFHVVDQWSYYATNPQQIFQFQQGGLAIWGALAGGGAAAIIYATARHIPIGRLLDIAVPAVLTAQIIGRFGCIINGDAYGGATSLPLGFIYTHPNSLIPPQLLGVPTHPYPVYEIVWNILVMLLLLRLRRHFAQNGLLFFSYLSLYSLGRLVLSFVRQENAVLWGLQQAQVLAIAIFIVSLIMFIFWSRKEDKILLPNEKR